MRTLSRTTPFSLASKIPLAGKENDPLFDDRNDLANGYPPLAGDTGGGTLPQKIFSADGGREGSKRPTKGRVRNEEEDGSDSGP